MQDLTLMFLISGVILKDKNISPLRKDLGLIRLKSISSTENNSGIVKFHLEQRSFDCPIISLTLQNLYLAIITSFNSLF